MIDAKSWHYRWFMVMDRCADRAFPWRTSAAINLNICSYVRTALVTGPLAIVLTLTLYTVIITALIGPMWLSEGHSLFWMVIIVGAVGAFVGLIFGIFWFGPAIADEAKLAYSMTARSVLAEYIRAKKGKYCPYLEIKR